MKRYWTFLSASLIALLAVLATGTSATAETITYPNGMKLKTSDQLLRIERASGFVEPFWRRSLTLSAHASAGYSLEESLRETSPWWVEPADGAAHVEFGREDESVFLELVQPEAPYLTNYVDRWKSHGHSSPSGRYRQSATSTLDPKLSAISHGVGNYAVNWFQAAQLHYWKSHRTFASDVSTLLEYFGLRRTSHPMWDTLNYDASTDSYSISYEFRNENGKMSQVELDFDFESADQQDLLVDF